MEETSKTENHFISGSFPDFLTESDDDMELSPDLSIKEEMIEEIMQELYKEITCSSSACINPTSSPASFPPSSPSPSPASSPSPSPLLPMQLPFAFGDGKSQSCGASVSNSASTVMAGVEFVGSTWDFGGVKVGLPVMGNGEQNNASRVVGKRVPDIEIMGVEDRMEGWDGVELGDEWLARVLGWRGPLEIEEWT